MNDLDRIDIALLDALQRDSRLTVQQLAERVGLSATPCSERVKRMEREGVIMGYYARVNPAALGKNLLVFLEIKLSSKSASSFSNVTNWRSTGKLLPHITRAGVKSSRAVSIKVFNIVFDQLRWYIYKPLSLMAIFSNLANLAISIFHNSISALSKWIGIRK
mgnify:CR=1 FL=1